MSLYQYTLLMLLLFFTCSIQAKTHPDATKCHKGVRLANTAPNGWADSIYYADHYCIMAKRPDQDQRAKLISGKQADGITSRYFKTFNTLSTDEERVVFIDTFIQHLSRLAWLTVSLQREGFSDLTITAQRLLPSSATETKFYYLGLNLFQGMHNTLIPKLNNYVFHERASAEVSQRISELVQYVIFGTQVDDVERIPFNIGTDQLLSANSSRHWEDNAAYEDWAEEQAEGTCERMDNCEFGWKEDDSTGERWIEFIDLNRLIVWDGYHYYRSLLQIPTPLPPFYKPY